MEPTGRPERWSARAGRPHQTLGALCTPGKSHGLNGPSPLTRRQVRHPQQVVSRSHKVPSQHKIGDRIAIMRDGEIIQEDSSEEIVTLPPTTT